MSDNITFGWRTRKNVYHSVTLAGVSGFAPNDDTFTWWKILLTLDCVQWVRPGFGTGNDVETWWGICEAYWFWVSGVIFFHSTPLQTLVTQSALHICFPITEGAGGQRGQVPPLPCSYICQPRYDVFSKTRQQLKGSEGRLFHSHWQGETYDDLLDWHKNYVSLCVRAWLGRN